MPTLRVALTGGIATGKSYVLGRFAALGVQTIDADTIARDVVQAGQPASDEIRAHFGDGVFHVNGEVDRARLAQRVFDDSAERTVLESIVHPRVRIAIDEWFAGLSAALAVADIPLLFETGRESAFDRVVVTACAPDRQRERLVARDAAHPSDAQKRMDAQLPTAEKVSRGDYVVWTDGSFAETDAQVETVYAALQDVAESRQADGR